MVRLQLIEKSITALNGSNFQNLCDAYMKLKHDDLISFNRTGSQIGKQKTIPGTPDTTIRLQDGNLWLVEFTTQHDGLVKKLKEDIDKCLNEELTEISAKEINEIILFHNSRRAKR